MSKKVISILLTAAMLVAMLCVGVGSVTAFADDTVTYYFLAPDDYFATNNSVGYYYWAPEENGPWPGLEMTPAPEVGENVFKCEVPDMDSTSTIIFNAFVDAGTPADPELAKNAHQTVNINTEGYLQGESVVYDQLGMELDDFYGMIYVLNNNDKQVNDFSGATTTGGEWFSIDPSAPNYYKNFENYYGTYNFSGDDTDSNDDTDSDQPSGKKYHTGDVVTVNYCIQNFDYIAGIETYFYFDPEYLDYVPGTFKTPSDLECTATVNDTQLGDMKGSIGAMLIYDIATGRTRYFANEGKPCITYTFTAKKDFNEEDLKLSYLTVEINKANVPQMGDEYNPDHPYSSISIYHNWDFDPEVAKQDVWTYIDYKITCNHSVDTDTSSDTDTASDTDTVSDTDTASDTDTSVTPDTDTSTTTDTDRNSDSDNRSSDSDTSSKRTNDTASKKTSSTTKTTSTSTTTSTVQTAGTFAVVSLVVILMAAGAVVLYTRKKTEE